MEACDACGKIHTFGAGVIDEVSALAKAPKAGEADESYVALSGSQVRDGLGVFTYEGALVETLPMELGMPSTGARVPYVAVPASLGFLKRDSYCV